MNNQVFKINEQYSICLDDYFDLESLHNIFPNIIEGVVKSKKYFEPIEIANQRAIFNKEHTVPKLYIRDCFSQTDEYKNLIDKGFTDQEIYEYVLFRSPVKTLGTKLLLRTYPDYSKEFSSKHLAALNEDLPAYENFPSLKKWIENSGAFDQVGRILFFINNLGSYTPTHCDYSNLQTSKDQFIWINIYQKKNFFVLDESYNKQYLKGEINTFDNASWHGSDPAKYSCFTIRVDGIFSDEFLLKTRLYEHFKKDI